MKLYSLEGEGMYNGHAFKKITPITLVKKGILQHQPNYHQNARSLVGQQALVLLLVPLDHFSISITINLLNHLFSRTNIHLYSRIPLEQIGWNCMCVSGDGYIYLIP